jgi:hypothetical protein
MGSAHDPVLETNQPPTAAWAVPSRWASALFHGKVLFHRLRRHIADFGSRPALLAKALRGEFPVPVAKSRTPLWGEVPYAEQLYQYGKVQNLRRAAAALDGLVIPADGVFSFWRQIGRPSRRRGFVDGRMLQEGCLVPAIGGGLCQLSNALYDAALQAGCDIVERHAHSRIVPGSAAAAGRDATVAWNYVDLRFRATAALRLEARLTRDDLIIRLCGQTAANTPTTAAPAAAARPVSRPAAHSCATCGETSCFRHEPQREPIGWHGAYLVDENWPEFQSYIAERCLPDDEFGVPLDGARWGLRRYRWDIPHLLCSRSATLETVARAIAIRRAPAQGPARRIAELRGAARIARRLASLLGPEVTHVCVAQSLLPQLWREGHLGGRQVEVLMTRLPMRDLQTRLDAALAAHPEWRTLGDFRAPPELVEAEAEALAYATRIVTPHAEIASLFPDKAVLLDWRLPPARAGTPSTGDAQAIAFPGPTVARKGAHALRDAARALDLDIVLLGSELEGADFWDGVAVRKPEPGGDWLVGVAAVVQPALVEERPRHLLAALAAAVPIIASPACGLAAQPGVTLVPPDDPAALIAAIKAVLGRQC